MLILQIGRAGGAPKAREFGEKSEERSDTNQVSFKSKYDSTLSGGFAHSPSLHRDMVVLSSSPHLRCLVA